MSIPLNQILEHSRLPPKTKPKQARIISDCDYDRWVEEQQMEREENIG
jgi:hypothetical protein